MQNSYEKFDEYSGVLNTDFSNWDDDFFSENSQFSDVENAFDSKNLIKSLQSTTNKNSSQTDETSFCGDEIFRREIVETLSSKEFGKINTSRNYIPQKEHKQVDISYQVKNKQSAQKNVHESSDSDDFCNQNKRYKRSKTSAESIFTNSEKDFTKQNFAVFSSKTYEKSLDSMKRIQHVEELKPRRDVMTIYNQESLGNQILAVSTQESCGSKMITSSQEASTSQKMSTSSQEISTSQKMSTQSQEISTSQKMSTQSQEISTSQKMSTQSQEISTSQKMSTQSQEISTSQKMVTSSQENSGSRNVFSNQEFCYSPKIITSSQESLGKKIMDISIEEDFGTLYDTNLSISGTIYPHTKKSNCQQSGILNQGTVSSETLNSYKQQNLDEMVSNKKMKIDISDKNNFIGGNFNTISDSLCKKTVRRYNKTEKRIIWSIRKRELDVTKRENAVEIREKLLDSREADIQKREQILKARERKYLKRKASMKKLIKKLNNTSKKSEEKIRCLKR